ncbi:MAG: hypothetical protein ACOY35_01290 [Bacillota bacterium]
MKAEERAIEMIIQYNNEANDDVCLDLEEKHPITNEEARNIIKKVCNVKNAPDFQQLDILTRNTYLKELKDTPPVPWHSCVKLSITPSP